MKALSSWFMIVGALSACLLTSAQETRFAVNRAEVFDRKTGITWQRCSAGQTWRDEHCTGNALQYNFDAAQRVAHDGWRLPTTEELASLVNDKVHPRRIADSTAFPDMPSEGVIIRYWTAESATGCIDDWGKGCGFAVNFDLGGDLYPPAARKVVGNRPARVTEACAFQLSCQLPRVFPGFVRLMRVDRSGPASPPAASLPVSFTTVNGRYRVQGNEVLDLRTGLVWQRCPSAGQIYHEGLGCTGVTRSYTLDQARSMARNGWRLPAFSELLGLMDVARRAQRAAPYIDITAFPK